MGKKRFRSVIDIAMTISMPVLMAYELAGEALHEYLGIAVFILFVIHHVLNWKWIKGIVKGCCAAARILNLAVNLLLLVIMFLLPFSGAVMSRHLFRFLDFGKSIAAARTVHLLASYWGFLLMSLHIGFHWNAMRSAIRSRTEPTAGIRKKPLYAALAAISAYGIYAFLRRGIADYLFLKNRFVFFDFSEPLIFFLLDYFAIMEAIACAGYYLMLALRKLSQKNSRPRAAE